MKTFCEDPLKTSSLARLEEIHGSDSILLDKSSCELLFQIETQMNRLACVGIDDMRTLWIETVSNKKVTWFQVLTRNYNGVHSLFLSSEVIGQVGFENELHQCDMGEKVSRHSAKALLTHLETYLTAVIDKIEDNADCYNDYVEKHLSFYEREGQISAKKYYTILPEEDVKKSKATLLSKLDYIDKNGKQDNWESMTLEKYIHAWRIAYEGYHDLKFESKNDLELFRRSAKGHEAQDYDLTSQKDFEKWCKENNSYHCFDVQYARVSLYPIKSKRGKWHFSFLGAHDWNIAQMINAAVAMVDGKIPFKFNSNLYRQYLNNEYTISISNDVYHYSLCEPLMRLPYPSDDISQEQIDTLVKAIKWRPLEKVMINSNSNLKKK